MNDVIRAFLRAFRSQLHPAMLMLALLPFFGALLIWGGVLWWYWDVVTAMLREWLLAWSWFGWLSNTLTGMGLRDGFLVPLFVFVLIFPLTILTAVLIAGMLAMPMILQHVCKRDYSGLVKQGEGILSTSLANALIAAMIFALGWLLTLPLWLIPPLALVLPFFWVAHLNLRVLRVDALVEHASPAELEFMLQHHSGRLWMLSIFCTLFCSIPLMWIVAPVFSGLAFAHYQLHALRGLRSQPAKTVTGDQ